MAKIEVTQNSTAVSIAVFIQDTRLTTGEGLTGLVYNTASLACYFYEGEAGAVTQLSLVTQTSTGAHVGVNGGGFAEKDATNAPGDYRLDLPDSWMTTLGRKFITLRGAANMAPVKVEIVVVPAILDAARAQVLDDLINGGRLDLLIDAIKAKSDQLTFTVANQVDANPLSIAGSTAAATNLKQSCLAIATGTVLTDAGNTTTTFKIDSTLGAKAANYFGDSNGGMVLAFVAGTANEWQTRRVISFDTTTDFVTLEAAFSTAPTASDAFILLGRITELT